MVQIGKTKLLCHLHPGRETCLECEPGVVRHGDTCHVASNREETRKDNLNSLKRKYGLDNPAEDLRRLEEKSYNDRARERRRLVGSSHESEKTVTASVDTAIDKNNKGFKMMAKMGFKGGSGLGKNNQGRAEPLKVVKRAERAGLGTESSVTNSNLESKKNAIWLKTQKRFTNTSVLDAFNQDDSDEAADDPDDNRKSK